jgi:hypothetical protein
LDGCRPIQLGCDAAERCVDHGRVQTWEG